MLRIVDAHHHYQDLERNHHPWLADRSRPSGLEGDLEPIRRNYLRPDLAADLATARVMKTVHVENGWDRRDPVGETRWLSTLPRDDQRPDAIIGFVDLGSPQVGSILDAHAAVPGFRGVRQILNWHDDEHLRVASRPDLMEDEGWLNGFALLEPHRLSFDLQIYWPQMDMAARLARRFPKTAIVLNHFGMPIDRSSEGLSA